MPGPLRPMGPNRPVNVGGPGIPALPVGQQIKGRPYVSLPGALNGRQAQKMRTPVAPNIPAPPNIDPDMQCLIEYL
ncbi:MAG TPA: hypothetical protein VM223_04250, partial [Planctomycetota bacterium]|nr:hypothetical protein [Planctomycetota bacterium]